MKYSIALAGNPNCGKTTLFNELTGSKQHVGNWPGVTVDKKEGLYKKDKDINILDLPGTYSLSPYSAEEIVARDYIIKEKPNAVINIVDATNIERNLYLTLQIIETRIPTVIALNMMDEVEARGDIIHIDKLSKLLGVKIVPIVARNGKGLKELMDAVSETVKSGSKPNFLNIFDDNINKAIKNISEKLQDKDEDERNWKAIKILEDDDIVVGNLSDSLKNSLNDILNETEKHADGDTEAKIADLRYQYISKVVKDSVKKKHAGHVETRSDKLDKILTNRFLAIPLFAIIMYVMFAITFGDSPIGIGAWLQGIVTDFWDGPLTSTVENFLVNAGAADWAISLVIGGILAGLGGVFFVFTQIFFFVSF
jgi:ferrous iron transport protein B